MIGGAAAAVDRCAVRLLPGLFADQFILVASPEPDSETTSAAK
jgi:hypothetical protein